MPYYILLLVFSVFGLSFGSIAAAQNNTLFIIQDSGDVIGRGNGNTLFLDQSEATGSRVGGSVTDQNVAAQQIGQNNFADLRISGTGGVLALRQIAQTSQLDGNRADIDLDGFNPLASLLQEGQNNTATIDVTGTLSSGVLEQIGNDNVGTVQVGGLRTSGRLIQNGNNNATGIVVDGNGSDVTVTQNGNNLTGAPIVVSNGATVIITQSRSY